jgi:hypothetical protein
MGKRKSRKKNQTEQIKFTELKDTNMTQETIEALSRAVIFNDNLYLPFHSDGFIGYKPVEVKKGTPGLAWEGGKITIDEPTEFHPNGLWREVTSFFAWAYSDYQGEAQVRLFYNRETKEWRAWAFPQEKRSGLSTVEIGDHPDFQNQSVDIGEGFSSWGTIHSHANCAAFQSGTDTNNEEAQNGIHITVGYCGKDELDLNLRVYLSHTKYGVNMIDWFEFPQEWDSVPEKMIKPLLEAKLQENIVVPFPDKWKENVIKVVPPFHATHTSPVSSMHTGTQGVVVGYQSGAQGVSDDSDLFQLRFTNAVNKLIHMNNFVAHFAHTLVEECAHRLTHNQQKKISYTPKAEKFIADLMDLIKEHKLQPWAAYRAVADELQDELVADNRHYIH